MFEWLFGASKDLPLWGQIAIDTFKILLGFSTVLIVTRWTLSRADRKDATARKAAALDKYSQRRIESLNSANASLGRVRISLEMLKTASLSDIKTEEGIEGILAVRLSIDHEVDEFLLACQAYGDVPGDVPCEHLDFDEAAIVWLSELYRFIDCDEKRADALQHAYEMCSSLQTQLKWLRHYELGMQIESANNPDAVWSNSFMPMLETVPLKFLAKQHSEGEVIAAKHEN